MATLATLTVKVIGDTSDFNNKMNGAQSTTQNVVGSLRKTGTILTAAVTAPLVGMGVSAVNAASDLEESMNKVNVVFGENANAIKGFVSTSAESLGLSKQAALEATGTFGNLFDAMGMGEDATLEMSTGLVQLAADLASFNNLDPTVALEKLRSGIVGETEPMRQLGVNVSATAVEMKALEMGLARTGKELTEQDKVTARYALIMEQTANAQGDFVRTSDGLANAQRILKAQVGDLAAEFGKQLIPYVKEGVKYLQQLITWFQGLHPNVQKNIVVVAALAAVLGPVLLIISTLIGAISAIGLPILLIIGLIAALGLAWKNNWGGIQEKTKAVIDFISPYITAALEWIKGVVQSALAFISAWWAQNGEQVMSNIAVVWGWIKSFISAAINAVRSIVQTVVGWITSFWNAHGSAIMAATKLAWENVKAIINGVIKVVQAIIKAFSAALRGDWYAVGQFLREAWDAAWNTIITVLRNAYSAIKGIVTSLVASIKQWFQSVNWGEVGRKIIDGIANGIKNGIPAIIDAAKKAAKAALDAAKGFLGIKSPSTAFMKLAKLSIRGFTIPFNDTRSIDSAIKGFANRAVGLSQSILQKNFTDNSQKQINYNVTGTFVSEPKEDIIQKLRLLTALTS